MPCFSQRSDVIAVSLLEGNLASMAGGWWLVARFWSKRPDQRATAQSPMLWPSFLIYLHTLVRSHPLTRQRHARMDFNKHQMEIESTIVEMVVELG